MAGEKMKTGTTAGMFAWVLAMGWMVLGMAWVISSWNHSAQFAWKTSGLFRLRMVVWVVIQIPISIIGAVALHRFMKVRFGKSVEDVRRENMVLREKAN